MTGGRILRPCDCRAGATTPSNRAMSAGPKPWRHCASSSCTANEQSYISRGLGRAYGDSALNREQGVILQTAQDRLLAFDAAAGPAGVRSRRFLRGRSSTSFCLGAGRCRRPPARSSSPSAGRSPPTCTAKTIIATARLGISSSTFDLLTAAGQVLHCSREENPDVFWATIGGMGLTGCI